MLIPDFTGARSALQRVVQSCPDVLNHNIESSRRVFPRVRPKDDYDLSLGLLARVKEIDPSMATKSGIIVGMGETRDEVVAAMEDLRRASCDLLAIGQYLRPSAKHLPIHRFYTPAEFTEFRQIGETLGFRPIP